MAEANKKKTLWILLAVLVLVLSLGRGGTDVPAPQATPTPAANASGMSNATVSSHQPTDETTGETKAALLKLKDSVGKGGRP